MPRRRKRPFIPVTLTLPAEPPTDEEIDAVLMATDAIISQAGRAGVVLILNGSRSQKVYRWEWDKLPDYGRLRHLTAKEIGTKVDWCIHHGWLRLEYRDGIPFLLHTPKGWERVKQLWVERLLDEFTAWQTAGQPEKVWPRLEHINREIKHRLLEAIEQQNRRDLTPVLDAWLKAEVRKVRAAINATLQRLDD
jgi:superfamily II DNA helicase RecQ